MGIRKKLKRKRRLGVGWKSKKRRPRTHLLVHHRKNPQCVDNFPFIQLIQNQLANWSDHRNWTKDQVSEWLIRVDSDLTDAAKIIWDKNVVGKYLKYLDKSDLQELGVADCGLREMFYNHSMARRELYRVL